MNQSMLSVRVSLDDKKDFEDFCSKAGINISTAINMFIKAVLRERKIPFEITDQEYNSAVAKKLLAAEESIKKGEKTYTEEEVINSINNIIKKNV